MIDMNFGGVCIKFEEYITCKKVTIQELANVVEVEIETYHEGTISLMFTTNELKRIMPFLRKILNK